MKVKELVGARDALALATLIPVNGAKAYKIGTEVKRLQQAISTYEDVVYAPLKRRKRDRVEPSDPEYSIILAEIQKAQAEAGEVEVDDISPDAKLTEDEIQQSLDGVKCAAVHIDMMRTLFLKTEPKKE